jgi:hypothetical protein
VVIDDENVHLGLAGRCLRIVLQQATRGKHISMTGFCASHPHVNCPAAPSWVLDSRYLR